MKNLNSMHGGNWAEYQERYGVLPLDFSSNISPLGLPNGVKAAAEAAIAASSRYPDPECRALRAALASFTGVPAESIFCGNGAADVIDRLVLALHPAQALITAPAFSEYASALKRVGCNVREYRLKETDNFSVTDSILSHITPELDLLILGEPNNPTGRTTSPALLLQIADACRENKVFLMVDECFLDFLPESSVLQPRLPKQRMLLLRAFTKFYGMAGLRLGYGLCSDEHLADQLKASGQPWPVSCVAQAAGIAALNDSAYAEELRQLITRERSRLQISLEELGCKVIPGEANYLLFSCEDVTLANQLEEKGILLRCCGNYSGLDEHWFRTAVRLATENDRLLAAIREVLSWQK